MNIGDRIDQCGLAGCFFNFGQSSNRPLNFFERCLPVAVHTFVGSVDAYLQTAHAIFCSRHARIAVGILVFWTPARGFPLNQLPFRELQDVPFVWLKQAISRSKTCRLVSRYGAYGK